jgi:hypothetical protein
MVALWQLPPISSLRSGTIVRLILSIRHLLHWKLLTSTRIFQSVLDFCVFQVPTHPVTPWCYAYIHHPSLPPSCHRFPLVFNLDHAAILVYPISIRTRALLPSISAILRSLTSRFHSVSFVVYCFLFPPADKHAAPPPTELQQFLPFLNIASSPSAVHQLSRDH